MGCRGLSLPLRHAGGAGLRFAFMPGVACGIRAGSAWPAGAGGVVSRGFLRVAWERRRRAWHAGAGVPYMSVVWRMPGVSGMVSCGSEGKAGRRCRVPSAVWLRSFSVCVDGADRTVGCGVSPRVVRVSAVGKRAVPGGVKVAVFRLDDGLPATSAGRPGGGVRVRMPGLVAPGMDGWLPSCLCIYNGWKMPLSVRRHHGPRSSCAGSRAPLFVQE